MNLTTLFIQNGEGIWHVLGQCVADVSTIFTPDQLLGILPFFRLFAALEYPYELGLQELARDGEEYFVVSGELSSKPAETGPDVASKFVYEIDKRDGFPRSLNETTFGGRFVDLKLDNLAINQPLDRDLFVLPNKPRLVMSSLGEYLDLRNQEWAKKLLE